jgi:hypothetical protein
LQDSAGSKDHLEIKVFDIRVHRFLSAFICVKILSYLPQGHVMDGRLMGGASLPHLAACRHFE